jgi:hypothetical protein
MPISINFTCESTRTSSAASASATPPNLDLTKLRTCVTLLITLARQKPNGERKTPYYNTTIHNTETYCNLSTRINAFFTTHVDFDFHANGACYDIMEMRALFTLVETAFGRAHERMVWPKVQVDTDERERIQRRVCVFVERVVVFEHEEWRGSD